MIHVEGLTKRYGERVLLEDVSWHVKKRDRIGLSGPNGSGKTTLLRMLAGLEEPDAGSIRMASDTSIGYLPQDGIVHHGRSIHEEVSLAFAELLALLGESFVSQRTLMLVLLTLPVIGVLEWGGLREQARQRASSKSKRCGPGSTSATPTTWARIRQNRSRPTAAGEICGSTFRCAPRSAAPSCRCVGAHHAAPGSRSR